MLFLAVPAVLGAGPAPPPSAEPLASPGSSPHLASPAPQPRHTLLLFPRSQAVTKRQLLPLHPRRLVGRFPVAYLIFIAWG